MNETRRVVRREPEIKLTRHEDHDYDEWRDKNYTIVYWTDEDGNDWDDTEVDDTFIDVDQYEREHRDTVIQELVKAAEHHHQCFDPEAIDPHNPPADPLVWMDSDCNICGTEGPRFYSVGLETAAWLGSFLSTSDAPQEDEGNG